MRPAPAAVIVPTLPVLFDLSRLFDIDMPDDTPAPMGHDDQPLEHQIAMLVQAALMHDTALSTPECDPGYIAHLNGDVADRKTKIGDEISRLRSRASTAEQELERMKARRFPIMDGPSIPWSVIAPFEAMAQQNHGQSVEKLASRGGLSMAEAIHVLECVQWHSDASRDIRKLTPTEMSVRLLSHCDRAVIK